MIVFLICVGILTLLIYKYYQKSFQYWEKKGVPTIKPSIPFGNLGSIFGGPGFILHMKGIYEEFKSQGVHYAGLYTGAKPALLAVHPEAVKTVMNKDFQSFHSHGVEYDAKEEPLQAHLFNLDGKQWKDMRVKLTPTFTSGKMKMMFQTLLDCGQQLEDFVEKCNEKNVALDIKEVIACFTTDVIGSCAFGLKCNSFKNADAQFRKYGRKVFTPSLRFVFRRLLSAASPRLMKLFKLKFIQEDVSEFFIGVIRDMLNYRKTEKITRNDFLQILINMQETLKSEGKKPFTLEELAAQAFVFFIAGFETSSTTVTFALYELVHNQEVQDKLREEIRRIIKKHDGKITYDGIMEMKYLDQVINETLRKYPPVHFLPRKCTQNYKLPNGAEVEKGTKVFISVMGLHRDEEYFPNPDKFDPDRFSDENKHNIVPYSYIPFGEGPRICIGLRFGVMQAKVGICLLLRNYKLYPHPSVKYPIEFDNKSAVLAGKDTLLLMTERV
nr:probable cytochrome P450 6a14 [Onthophagus taurus]